MPHFLAVQRNSFFSFTHLKKDNWLQKQLVGLARFPGSNSTIFKLDNYLYCTTQKGQDPAKLKLMEQVQSDSTLLGSAEVPAQIKRNTVPQHLHPNKDNLCACSKTLIKLFCFWSYHLIASTGVFALCLLSAADVVLQGVTR